MQKASRVAASDSIPCDFPSSCNGLLVSWVKDADGFNLNLISFLYVVVSSSPKKATIVSFRLGQQLICYIFALPNMQLLIGHHQAQAVCGQCSCPHLLTPPKMSSIIAHAS